MDIDQHMEVVLRFCGFNPVQELAIQADDLDTFKEVHRVQEFERDSKIPSLAMCHDRASFMRNIKLFPTFILAVENQLSPMMGEMAVGRVHHFVQSLKTGKMSESWLKKQRSKLAKADRLRDTITYKSERTMTFKKFLTKMDSMINGFIDGGEPLSESQKVRLLITKVQHPQLEAIMTSIKIQHGMENSGGYVLPTSNVGYAYIANAIIAEVKKLSAYTPGRQVSSMEASKHGSPEPENGIHNPDGSIDTGYYRNFRALSSEQKNAVINERKRLSSVSTPKGSKRGHGSDDGGGDGGGDGDGGSERNASGANQQNKKGKLMQNEIATAKSQE